MEINAPLLTRALDLRRKIAALLGYKTWADYITEVKMIKNGAGVESVRIPLASPVLRSPTEQTILMSSSWPISSRSCVLSAQRSA